MTQELDKQITKLPKRPPFD